MHLMIYFFTEHWRQQGNPLLSLYGRYSFVGFAFSDRGKLTLFGTKQGGVFSRFDEGQPFTPHLSVHEGRTDLLLPDLEDDTVEKIYRTCDALARTKIEFNLQDLLFIHFPFDVPEIPLFECKTLNNTQAVILILRECLPKDHEMMGVITGLHSRMTFAETLYDRIALYCVPVFNAVDFAPPTMSDKRLGRTPSN